ncbi:MAG TPA: hypothetical protein VGJ21_08345 [Terracidiphilus sp.]|jgi:hypothetical protein
MFTRRFIAPVAVCTVLFVLGFAPLSAQDKRGPSTPEERQQALDYIHHFQSDPLNPSLKSETQWVTMWAIEVPDIHVNLCFLVDLPKGDKKHSQTLFTAMMLAQTGFGIEHRDGQADVNAEYLAGLDALLSAYEKVVAANAKDRQPALDDLLERRKAGTLADFVKTQAPTRCKK